MDNIFLPIYDAGISPKNQIEYFKRLKTGDLSVRDKLISANIKLVIYIVNKEFKNINDFEKRDLVSEGIIGLIKAVDTFDITKGTFFSYAYKCIHNEILIYFRKKSKYAGEISLDLPINEDESMLFKDLLKSDECIEDNYINKETENVLKKCIVSLSERDTFIISMYFGFFGYDNLNQKKIGELLGITQSYVSRLLKSIIVKLEYINQLKESQKIVRRGKKADTIFKLLPNYSKGIIYKVINELPEEDKILIELRYGKNLEYPSTSILWNKNTSYKFYNKLLPKIKRKVEQKLNENVINNIMSYKEQQLINNFNEFTNYLYNLDFTNAIISLHKYLDKLNLLDYENFIINLLILSVKEQDFTFIRPIRNLVLLKNNCLINIDKYKEYFYEALVKDLWEAKIYLEIIIILVKKQQLSFSLDKLNADYESAKRILIK